MGKYSVGAKQDISGIATLTDNPVAVDNVRSELKRIWDETISLYKVPKSAFPDKE